MSARPRPPASPRPAPPPPPWFREVVWSGLLAASAQLLPTPFVDDFLEGRVRRRMAERMALHYGVTLTPGQADLLAGKEGGWSLGRLAGKAFLYPIKKIVRKIVYILAVKQAMDTLSDVFHRGYVLRSALERGALEGPTVDDDRVRRVADRLRKLLDGVDTRPVGNAVKGVFRNSRRLVGATLGWLGRQGRHGVDELEAAGASRESLERESPAAEQLLDRLLLVLWGRSDHLADLDRTVARALSGDEEYAHVGQVRGEEDPSFPAAHPGPLDQEHG